MALGAFFSWRATIQGRIIVDAGIARQCELLPDGNPVMEPV